MPAALQRRREYTGPALFAYGFRPFFLAAGVWGAFGILLWLPLYSGELSLPARFGALDWHIHEMLYGYVAATVAGFLTISYGKERPVAVCNDISCWSQNRRAVTVLNATS